MLLIILGIIKPLKIYKGVVLALFGKSKDENENQTQEVGFQNIIIDTENVNQELKNISSSQNIPLNQLDFTLLSFKSVFKTHKDDEWMEINKSNIEQFRDEDFLLNEELQIKQQYKVEIFLKDKDKLPLLEIILGGNKFLTKIIATVKKNFDIKYSSKLKDYIAGEINKRLLKQSMLISIFQSEMEKEVEKIVSKIRINNFLDEDHIFIVCNCVEPITPINDNLIFHYKKNINKKDEHGRIDYSKRGYIQAVQKGDIIIEYIKAKEGRNGRNCKGELLKVKEPEQKYSIDFTVSENIEKKEDENRIIFVAKKDGYVNKEGDKYDINDNMEIEEVSFKTTGSIEANLESNVKINIKESDVLKDAIGPGMSVETTEITVEGNIGSGAVVKAKIAKIGGQTHKNASIYADEMDISVHRGYAEGENVTIKRLEGGRVNAKVVKIDQAIGGEVIAERIFIKQLVSNVTMIASEIIEISELKGTNNKFIIDPSRVLGFQEKIDELEKKLKKIESAISITKKAIREKKILIDKNREPAELVKQKIIELKRSGQEPAKTLIKKIKDFQQLIATYNSMLDKYKKEKEERENIKKEIDDIQSTILKAKIINHSVWHEYNEIKFVLLSPKIEITHVTKEGEISKSITLSKVEEGEYQISRKSEFDV